MGPGKNLLLTIVKLRLDAGKLQSPWVHPRFFGYRLRMTCNRHSLLALTHSLYPHPIHPLTYSPINPKNRMPGGFGFVEAAYGGYVGGAFYEVRGFGCLGRDYFHGVDEDIQGF